MGAEVASALSSVSSSNGGNGSSRNASARAMSYDSGDKLVDRSSLSLGGGGGGRRGVGLLQCILLEMEQVGYSYQVCGESRHFLMDSLVSFLNDRDEFVYPWSIRVCM